MPDMNINFFPGSACQNLGSYDGCVDGWHLYSIPISSYHDPYSFESVFGICDSHPDNIHTDGLQVMTEGSVALCYPDLGWIGSIQSYTPINGYYTRNIYNEPFSITLTSDLPPIEELPIDNDGNPSWKTLNYGMNLLSFPGTDSSSDGWSCMSADSPHWYYRIQYTLDQYHYSNNPIRNKHEKLILSSAYPDIDTDDFSWIFSYQDKVSDACPNSTICCHHLCENDGGEYNCSSDVSLGWGNLGNLMCNYTNTCCGEPHPCTYLDGEYALNYGIDSSCQILHPKQQGVCVYSDWDSSPNRNENYCRSLPTEDCLTIEYCVENNYCRTYNHPRIYGECRISELLPLGDIQEVIDVPGSEHAFEWNPSENPACGEGYLGHYHDCDDGSCMNAYHHCYACGGEWIPTGPLIDPNDSCHMIADSIESSVSNVPANLEVLTYTVPLPDGLNYPIWAIHGSRCFGDTYGFWVYSEDDNSHFTFFPNMESYYLTSQNYQDNPSERNYVVQNGSRRFGNRCRTDAECPATFYCGDNNLCVPIQAIDINSNFDMVNNYMGSTLFGFDSEEWSIYMYNGTTGVDSEYSPMDRGPSDIIIGGPEWDIPKSLINDVIRSGVTKNNHLPPMPINYRGGYKKYIQDYHRVVARKSKIPKGSKRKLSKKMKRRR